MHVIDPNPDGRNRAVSPVIGVILMVAITVILAAVIGAFVLEIGDQQETAPNTSFDSEQQTEFFTTGSCQLGGGSPPNWGSCANYTVVELNHAGGSNIDITQLTLKYRGNESLWGAPNDGSEMYPQPDIRATLGSNEQVAFTSGEQFRVMAFQGIAPENVENCQSYNLNVVGGQKYPKPRIEFGSSCDHRFGGNTHYNAEPMLTQDAASQHNFDEPGHDVNLVWVAESGGKTQNLFKYTVQ